MAEMIPFPAVRRRGYAGKTARKCAGYTLEGARSTIAAFVAQHRARLDRLGVREELAARDAKALEAACWSEIRRHTIGGVA